MELLIQILLYALPKDWSAGDLQLLASVCKYWHNIILTTPRFWRVVDSRRGRYSLSQALRHNKAGPLDIRIWGREGFSQDHDSISQLIQLITSESRRICSIYFDTYRQQYFQPLFENVSLPSMDELTVMTWPVASVPTSIRLGDGVPLRYLHLSSVTIPWDLPRLSGLKVLTLWNLDRHFPTSTQLYHILTSTRSLERFSFLHWKSDPNTEYPGHKEIAPIKLPLLTSVEVRRIPEPIKAHILSMLDNLVLEDVVWTSVQDMDSGYTLLRWSSTAIKVSQELVVRWHSWSQTLDIGSREWKETSTLQMSRRPVDLSIQEIQNPSEFIEEFAKLLSKSNSVVLETDSTEVATRARTAFERSRAAFSIPILA